MLGTYTQTWIHSLTHKHVYTYTQTNRSLHKWSHTPILFCIKKVALVSRGVWCAGGLDCPDHQPWPAAHASVASTHAHTHTTRDDYRHILCSCLSDTSNMPVLSCAFSSNHSFFSTAMRSNIFRGISRKHKAFQAEPQAPMEQSVTARVLALTLSNSLISQLKMIPFYRSPAVPDAFVSFHLKQVYCWHRGK